VLTIAVHLHDDDDESPKNKKRKANSTKRGNGRASGPSIGQPMDKLLKPFFEPSNATGTLVSTILVSNAIPSFSALNCHSGLSNRFGDDHKTHSQGANNQIK